MTEDQATEEARLMFGARGYAYEQRSFLGNEKPGSDGWVSPAGPVYGYAVGYHRIGKRGARLSTQKGFGTSFEEALRHAYEALTPNQREAFRKRKSKQLG